MIFVLRIINNVNNIERAKIIGPLLVTHYSEYKHPSKNPYSQGKDSLQNKNSALSLVKQKILYSK